MRWPWQKKKTVSEKSSKNSSTIFKAGRDNNAPLTSGTGNIVNHISVQTASEQVEPLAEKSPGSKIKLKKFLIRHTNIISIEEFEIDFRLIVYPYVSSHNTTHMCNIKVMLQITFGTQKLLHKDKIVLFGLKSCIIDLMIDNSYIEPMSIYHGDLIKPFGDHKWKINNIIDSHIEGCAIYKNSPKENDIDPLCTLKANNESKIINSCIKIVIGMDDLSAFCPELNEEKIIIEKKLKKILNNHIISDDHVSRRIISDKDVRLKIANLSAKKNNKPYLGRELTIGEISFQFIPNTK